MTFRIAPTTTRDSRFFWDALKEHRLLVQRCGGCGSLRHPPRPMCPTCNSLAWDTVAATGDGHVVSFVMPHHPPSPGFDDPYIVVLVELDEGVRMVANLTDIAPRDVAIGMRVRAYFEGYDGGLTLVQFRQLRQPTQPRQPRPGSAG